MENLTLLLFGHKLPPHRHLHKLSNKFINIFLKEREKETFNESDYYVVIIEERYFGDEQREYLYRPVIPVHKDFLYQVQSIYGKLNAETILCTMQHEHPFVAINNIEYEGYCYYAKNSNEKILFFDTVKEPLTKSFIKMPKEVNAEKVMRNWLNDQNINKFN
ncbi:hypothetical protein [Lysinibacillus sp. RS5]|uniref:hypothetical protein n=1 Tax=unclassified Lysinibacillus TaxID=2636778 RepID=UPI0035BE394C